MRAGSVVTASATPSARYSFPSPAEVLEGQDRDRGGLGGSRPGSPSRPRPPDPQARPEPPLRARRGGAPAVARGVTAAAFAARQDARSPVRLRPHGPGIPSRRILLQAASRHGGQRAGNGGRHSSGRLVEDGRAELEGSLALERPLAREHLVEKDSEGPDVAERVAAFSPQHLRRHVAQRARDHPGGRRSGFDAGRHALSEATRQAEVEDLDPIVRCVMTFELFRSRCTMPCSCAWASAPATWPA